MNLKTLFGINGVNGEKHLFNDWATKQLQILFPFVNNLKGDSEIVYNQIPEFKKFKNSKILIIGGGPSTNEVEWQNIEYDYIFSLNNFFKNMNDVKIDLMAVGSEVDLQGNDYLNYVNKYNPILMFEFHNKWFGQKQYFEALHNVYPKISCFHTRAYGKLGGAIRLLILALYLKAKEIYIVGSDGCPGLSVTHKKFTTPVHSFENGKTNLPWRIDESNAYEIYFHQHKVLWNYLFNDLNINAKIYNLGEDCEFNFSSIWSKQLSPLTDKIKIKIKKKG